MLATNPNKRGNVKCFFAHPIVGSKWNGKPQIHFDSQAGTYWESMPKLGANEEKIQRALLKRVATTAQPVVNLAILFNEELNHVEQSKSVEPASPRPATGFTAGTIAKTGSSD